MSPPPEHLRCHQFFAATDLSRANEEHAAGLPLRLLA